MFAETLWKRVCQKFRSSHQWCSIKKALKVLKAFGFPWSKFNTGNNVHLIGKVSIVRMRGGGMSGVNLGGAIGKNI